MKHVRLIVGLMTILALLVPLGMVGAIGPVTWGERNNGLEGGFITAIAEDPTNANIIYAGTAYWLFRSTNGGDTWQKLHDEVLPNTFDTVLVDPYEPSTIYASSLERVFKITGVGGA